MSSSTRGDSAKKRLQYYPFNSNWIVKQEFNWQNNHFIEANRSFSQFMLFNISSDSQEDKNKSLYIFGPAFHKQLELH